MPLPDLTALRETVDKEDEEREERSSEMSEMSYETRLDELEDSMVRLAEVVRELRRRVKTVERRQEFEGLSPGEKVWRSDA